MNDLKRFLTINSIFSMFSGMILLIFSGRLKDFFEVENNYVFPVIGLNLILFSIFIRFAL